MSQSFIGTTVTRQLTYPEDHSAYAPESTTVVAGATEFTGQNPASNIETNYIALTQNGGWGYLGSSIVLVFSFSGADVPTIKSVSLNSGGVAGLDASDVGFSAHGITVHLENTTWGPFDYRTATITVTFEEPPVLSNALIDQSASENANWSYQFAANAFTDANGDAISYTATRADGTTLPDWVHFDSDTRTFTGTPPDNSEAQIDVKVTASSAGGTVSDDFRLTVALSNDAPVLVGLGSSVGYTEQSSAVVLDSSITLTDPDGDPQMAFATVTISAGYTAGDMLGFTVPAGSGITGSYNSDTHVLFLSGIASVADYQTVLQSVTFSSTSDDPTSNGTAPSRTISWQVTDPGGLASTAGTSTVSVTATNDAPVLGGLGSSISYTEGPAAVVLDNAITLTDADDARMSGATVMISAGFTAGDVLGFTAPGGSGITGSYDSGAHMLTLSGNASIADYRAALESVTFASTSDDPTAISASRTVSWQVTDANSDGVGAASSTMQTSTITITAVNDAPVIDSVSAPTTGIAGKPVSFDASATDPEGTPLIFGWNFGDGTFTSLTAPTHTYGATGNYTVTLTITDADGGSSSTTRTVTIENHAPTANAGGPYAIQAGDGLTLNGGGSSDPDGQPLTYAWDLNNDGMFSEASEVNPTLTWAQLQALGRTSGSYGMQLQVSDGFGGVATTLTTLYVNNAPTATADNASITEDGLPNPISGNVRTNDSDLNGDTLSITNAGTFVLPHGSLELHADGSYTYLLDNSNPAVNALNVGGSLTDTFTYNVSDGHGGTASGQLSIKINGVNDAPVLGGDNAITVVEGGLITITTADLTATDVDNTDAQLTFTVIDTSHGSVQIGGSAVSSFTQDDIVNGRVKFLHDGGEADGSFTVSLTDGGAPAGNGPIAPLVAKVTATVNPHVDDAPTVGDITLPSIVVNSGAHTITEAQLLADASDIEGDALHVTGVTIDSGLGLIVDNHNGTWSYTPKINDDTRVAFAFQVSDGQLSTIGHAKLDITPVQSAPALGTPGDDTFVSVTGNSQFDGGLGVDTITFDFKLTDAVVSFVDNKVIIDGPASHAVLSGIEVFKFADGTVNNADGNPLIDDLFYYANYHDVWLAGADADVHYATYGWTEGRDPNAFFSTKGYLAAYTDVKAAGINPLTHYDTFGFKEGRDPSPQFDTKGYLAADADVKAAGVDPLAHFLLWGAQEARHPVNDGHFG